MPVAMEWSIGADVGWDALALRTGLGPRVRGGVAVPFCGTCATGIFASVAEAAFFGGMRVEGFRYPREIGFRSAARLGFAWVLGDYTVSAGTSWTLVGRTWSRPTLDAGFNLIDDFRPGLMLGGERRLADLGRGWTLDGRAEIDVPNGLWLGLTATHRPPPVDPDEEP